MRASMAVVCGLSLLAGVLAAQQTPEKSLADLQAGPGLDVRLWASEPMVTNPTNLTIDERGRVWVLEAVNYRRALRNQPDLRATGDRVVILEDTNGDAAADKVTVFDQGPHLRAPLGIAVLGDKVYVSQSPDLIVYTKDAQDRIVSREVLLTGFGGVDHDHGLHAVVFGPDGRFYFNQGNTGMSVTDRSGRVVQSSSYLNDALTRPDAGFFQGVSLRMNPDGTNLEVIGQNFRNPYELALDSFGNVFQTDNDDDGNAWTRLNYVMEGGNFGFFGPLHRTWQNDRGGHFHNELPGVVPNILRLGPGSPCGLVVYEGTLLPAEYRGMLMHAEAGKRIIGGYPLTRDGAGFSTRIQEVVFGGADTWFRPSDVAVAPDGAVFVADWYDPGVGGHNMGDSSGGRGRIYRVAPPAHTPRVPAVTLTTDAGLTAAFGSPNQSVRYLAHQALLQKGASAGPLLQALWRGRDVTLRARALWILGSLPGVGRTAIDEALKDQDPRFRTLGLRVARRNGLDILQVAKPLLRDPAAEVRGEIAVLLRDADPNRMTPPFLATRQALASDAWLEAMTELMAQYDGRDRWYLEALAIGARGREEALYARMKARPIAGQAGDATASLVWALRPKGAIPDLVAAANEAGRPLAQREAAVDALVNMEWPEARQAIELLIASPATPEGLAGRAFAGFARQVFSLWPDARTSAGLGDVVRRGLAIRPAQTAAVDLVGRLADRQFLPDLRTLAATNAADPEARSSAVTLLATTRDVAYLKEFQALATAGPTPVRVAAVRAAGSLASPEDFLWAQAVLLSDAPNEVRVEALRVMAAGVPGVNALLDLAESARLPAEFRSLAASLTNAAALGRGGAARGRGAFSPPQPAPAGPGVAGPGRGAAAPDPSLAAIRERASRVLPLPATSGAVIPGVQALERNYRGNATAGRRVFEIEAGCASCHSLGGARKVGPDLSAIGTKYGKQAMLDHILRPNDAIGLEYVITIFELRGGETVSGIVTESAPDRIVVRLTDSSERRLTPADVLTRRASGQSLMPEGLLSPLGLQQVSDLLEFLATQTSSAR